MPSAFCQGSILSSGPDQHRINQALCRFNRAKQRIADRKDAAMAQAETAGKPSHFFSNCFTLSGAGEGSPVV